MIYFQKVLHFAKDTVENYFSPLEPYIAGTEGKVSRVGLHALTVIVAIAFMPQPCPFVFGTFIGYVAPESITKALSLIGATIERFHIGFIAVVFAIALVFHNTLIAMASFYMGGYITAQIAKIIAERKELTS